MFEVQNDQDYQEKVKTAAGPASMLGLGLGRPCDASIRKLGYVRRKILIQNDQNYQEKVKAAAGPASMLRLGRLTKKNLAVSKERYQFKMIKIIKKK